jgi:hypothetical protein
MNELMTADTHDFAALARKHGDFLYPQFKIEIDGKDLVADLGYHTDSVSIEQTIGSKSGSLSFNITNAYDLKSRSFNPNLKTALALGTKVKASLGYKTPAVLFSGFIGNISFSFSENSPPKVTVSCLDIRRLMMQGRLYRTEINSTFVKVLTEIMSYYKSLVTRKFNYDSAWSTEKSTSQQITNDFKYVYDNAQKRGYEFFVLGEHAYIRKAKSNSAAITTLEWGESILSFSRSYSYQNIEFKGVYYDENNQPQTTVVQSEGYFAANNPIDTPVVEILDLSSAKTADDKEQMVEAHKENEKRKSAGGQVKCIGLPEIVPGRFIKLKNLDSGFLDKKYYIEQVTHSFGSGGYTTQFNISAEE